MSVVIHEVSHGYAALYLGDPTAKYERRLTLNPLRHLDMLGSVIIPLITVIFGGFVFGWAKPVPFNPHNLKNPRRDEALIAAAGPVSNLAIALVASAGIAWGTMLPPATLALLMVVVYINIGLMVFNLVPIYPLDGSKILFSLIPSRYDRYKGELIRYSVFLFLVFIVVFSEYVGRIVEIIVQFLITSLAFFR